MMLTPWQQRVFDQLLGRRADGSFVHPEVVAINRSELTADIFTALGLNGRAIESVTITLSREDVPMVEIVEHLVDDGELVTLITQCGLIKLREEFTPARAEDGA